MRPKEIFSEFITLGYSPGIRPTGLKDISLSNYMIARITRDGWNILNLYNGTNIFISWSLVDIFDSLNTWGGDRVLNCIEIKDSIDEVILTSLSLVILLSKGQGNLFIEALMKLCNLGTKIFQEWCLVEFNLEIYPIEFNSLDRYIKL